MKLREDGQKQDHEVEIVSREGDVVHARIDGREVSVRYEVLPDGGVAISIGGRRIQILSARRKDTILVTVGPRPVHFTRIEEGGRRGFHGLASPEVVAPMPGKILRVMVKEGDAVTTGQPLVVMEAMKMETTLAAESDAIVKRVVATAGQMVDHGAVLIELSPAAVSTPARPL